MKTRIGEIESVDIKREVDDIEVKLLKIRRRIIETYEGSEEIEAVEVLKLSQDQIEYLLDLLRQPDIEEEDAELILSLMREHSADVAEYLFTFFVRFPNLIKNIYIFCDNIEDKPLLANQILKFLSEHKHISEYQLFWLAKIAEDYLLDSDEIGDILNLLYENQNSTQISKAKVLEIPENRFGMDNLREEQLRVGKSDWLSWAAAMGCRYEKPANRNHLLGYFCNISPMNDLIGNFVKNFTQ